MCQKGALLPGSVDLVQAQNCQVDLTHAHYSRRFLGHLWTTSPITLGQKRTTSALDTFDELDCAMPHENEG